MLNQLPEQVLQHEVDAMKIAYAKDVEGYEALHGPIPTKRPSAKVEGDEQSTTVFPVARVKRVLKADSEVKTVSREAVFLLSKAAVSILFVQDWIVKSPFDLTGQPNPDRCMRSLHSPFIVHGLSQESVVECLARGAATEATSSRRRQAHEADIGETSSIT